MSRRMFSLRYKILIFSLLMALVPILIVGSFSYIWSTNIVREQASNLNLEALKQTAYNIEFIVNDVRSISLNLISNNRLIDALKTSDAEDFRRDLFVQNLLGDYTLTKNHVFSIYIQGPDGNGYDTRSAFHSIEEEKKAELRRLEGRGIWSLDVAKIGNRHVGVLSFSRAIRDVNNIGQILGYMQINLSLSHIRDLYDKQIDREQGLFFIIDPQRTILSTDSSQLIGQTLENKYLQPRIFAQNEGYYSAVIDGRDYLIEFSTIEQTGWKLINYIPMHSITRHSAEIKHVTVFSVMLSLLIIILFLLFFMIKVLKPLKQIRGLMKNLENENFSVSMNVQGNDEIAMLARSFNKMSRKLDELVNEVHVVKIRQKEAEIKALEQQINPHFLYNTLDLIYWVGRMEKAFETSSLIQTLSQLYRIGLNRGSGFTLVRKELEYIEHYMIIQRKRFDNAITFQVSAEPETLDCKVVKLILQPLIENAITHGIEPKGGFGSIEVRIYREDGTLIYEVADDGVGMDVSAAEQLNDQTNRNRGVGLKNINDRIKLTFGNEYGLKIESRSGEGTKVIVKQPFIKGGETDVQSHARG